MIPAQYFSVSFYPNPPFSVNNGKSHLYPGRSMSVNVQSMFTQWSNVLCKCAVQNVRGAREGECSDTARPYKE